MRILHVTTFLQGGAGRAIASLAIAQRRAGHQVDLIADGSPEPGYGTYPEYEAMLASAGLAIVTVSSTFKRDLALNASAAQRLRALVGRAAPDVVHAHAAIPALVARLALASSERSVFVQTMHGWGVGKTDAQSLSDIALLGLADAVVTPSRASAETLRRLGLSGAPLHVIPYGIEPCPPAGAIDPSDAALLAACGARGRRVALCIGTIGERKNQALVVEAMARPELEDVEAVFIGDGDVAGLTRRAALAGVSTRVHVLGYRADASRYLAAADVLVLPSRNEGLPIAVLEALRAGVPVVASAIPEIEEAIADGRTGHLAAPDDAGALARALRSGLDSAADITFRRRLRELFEERYSLERMTSAYDRLYRRLCARAEEPARLEPIPVV